MSVSRVGSSPVQGGDVASTKRSERANATNEARKTGYAEETDSSAKSEISSRAKDFAKAREVAASAPDVREEKVAELKRRIQSGMYKVDADAIADRMIQDHAAL